jgi:hypothetical protein
MRTQLAYETRNGLEYQRVKKRRRKIRRARTIQNQRVRGNSKLKRIALLAGLTISGAGIGAGVGNGAYHIFDYISNRIRTQKAWNNLVTKYGDTDNVVGVSAQEKDALFKRVLINSGMKYENGTLFYSANGKKASVKDLRNALENYNQPIVMEIEK